MPHDSRSHGLAAATDRSIERACSPRQSKLVSLPFATRSNAVDRQFDTHVSHCFWTFGLLHLMVDERWGVMGLMGTLRVAAVPCPFGKNTFMMMDWSGNAGGGQVP